MKIVLASANKKKADELKHLLPSSFQIITLKDAGIEEEIPETGNSFEANAMQKARYVYDKTGLNVIADDSGLEVKALKGAPGIYSARYAGEHRSDDDNITKLLHELRHTDNRKANFRCVIHLVMNGADYAFDGRCNGNIIYNKKGSKGFGYDPIFVPEGYTTTFAEMDAEEKNKISHRAKAMERLISFLCTIA